MNYITLEQLQQLFPLTKRTVLGQYVDSLNFFMEEGEIITKNRICAFLSQVGVESAGMSVVKENLNYSAQGLLKTFGKYFPTRELAQQYERIPEMIANRVYANRMGNGPENSGDGWKFRGRGLIQVTGKNNYNQFASDRGLELEEAISYLETPDGASESAVWFWTMRNINKPADEQDILTVTKLVNGGTHGLEQRMEYYHTALSIFE